MRPKKSSIQADPECRFTFVSRVISLVECVATAPGSVIESRHLSDILQNNKPKPTVWISTAQQIIDKTSHSL